MKQMLFGLTGGIACGKSTITRTFRNNSIPMVDADVVARQVVEPGRLGYRMLSSYFGKDYFFPDGSLDRAKLGATVFADKQAMKALNSIMAPLIDDLSTYQFEAYFKEGYNLVGYDAALLIENGNADNFRPLIVVSCPPELQIERLIKRNNLTGEQAKARIDAQLSLTEKVKLADFVIDTSGTMENSMLQTMNIIKVLKSK